MITCYCVALASVLFGVVQFEALPAIASALTPPAPHDPIVSAGLRAMYVCLIYSNKSQKF